MLKVCEYGNSQIRFIRKLWCKQNESFWELIWACFCEVIAVAFKYHDIYIIIRKGS